MKKIKTLIIILLIFISSVLTSCTKQPEEPVEEIIPEVEPAETISITGEITKDCFTKYGNLYVSTKIEDMLERGFDFGDVVTVSFLDQNIDLPLVAAYSDVDSQKAGIFLKDDTDIVTLAINGGDFTTTYGIAAKTTHEDKTYEWNFNEGVKEPVEVTFTLKDKAGYKEDYLARHIFYTNERSDYKDLTDEQFANFREVRTTGIGTHTLYRSASAVDNKNNRAVYADPALRDHHINVIVNLADDPQSVQKLEGYEDSYYSTVKHIEVNAGMDLLGEDFNKKLVEAFTYMADNEGIYDVFCVEGKDRTGYVIALLECLNGASYEEVVSDYMITYYNYYGIDEYDPRYEIILNRNIKLTLEKAFKIEDLSNADLKMECEEFLKEIGLSEDIIERLRENLSFDHE